MKAFFASDGERPAVVSYVANGELRFGKVTFCKDYISDADEAVRLLLAGKRIKLQQIAALFGLVQRSVDGVLRERAIRPVKVKNMKSVQRVKPLRSLTPRQSATLDFLSTYVQKHGYSPTVREMCAAGIVSSTSVAAYTLDDLEGYGLLTRHFAIARSIVLTDAGKEAWAKMQATAAVTP